MVSFWKFIENINNDRMVWIDKLTKTCQEVYGSPPHPNVVARWQTLPIEDLQRDFKWLDTEERTRIKIDRQIAQRKKEKEALSLNGYDRIEPGDVFERVICGGIGQNDMSMYKLDHLNDSFLHDYYGVYVGDADDWLDWMVDDGYCDNGNIFIYDITIPPNPPFYIAEDPNSGGWAGEYGDRQVPDAQIIFSTIQVIPRRYIKLKKRIGMSRYWRERKRRERQYD